MKQPHIIIFPFVAEGHRKPLLCIAQSLSLAGIHVTFVHTNHYHLRFADQISALSDALPNLRFESISDGLPDEHPRMLGIDYFVGLKEGAKPHFKKLVVSFHQKNSTLVTCIIADGLMSFPFEVAQDLGIPYFCFHGTGARYALACLNNPKLSSEENHVTIPYVNKEEDEINSIQGLEGIMQRKDIHYLVAREDTPSLQFLIKEMHITTQAIAFIINTFDDLEAPCLPHLTTFYNKIYRIGPVHALLASKLKHSSKPTTPIILKQGQNCLSWLDSQPTRSVLYVSFGTLVRITTSELLELWQGLVDSGYPFLWVIREDFILNSEGENGKYKAPFNIQMGINGKGYIVSWAPQEQVLNHKSIRGFFTHAGWNSVLESIVAKVPMMYWSGSRMGDLYLNSLCMKNLWRIGIELETLERLKIKEKIKIFMESSGKEDEFIQSSVFDKIARSALDAVSEGGSSYCNFEALVQVIKNYAK